MKNGKKPTVRQIIFIEHSGIDHRNYLVSKDTPNEMVLINRYTNQVRTIRKTK